MYAVELLRNHKAIIATFFQILTVYANIKHYIIIYLLITETSIESLVLDLGGIELLIECP